MSWAAIPDTDIDANSALKTTTVLKQLRDNWELTAAGDASVPLASRIGLQVAYLENQPYGYIKSDGAGGGATPGCIVTPVEISSLYIFEESTTWTIPAGVRQVLVECWGAGSWGFTGFEGGCGAYLMKLVDVTPGTTMSIVVGKGGANSPLAGGPSSFSYGTGITAVNAQASGGVMNASSTASGGDINIDGGGLLPVRAGGGTSSGEGIVGAPGSGWNQSPGGDGRVSVRVIG